MEVWKDIGGWEGLYQASTFGRIKSFYGGGRILKKSINLVGYFTVRLCKNKKQITKTVHRLVLKAFVPNSENKPCINHKDFNKLNNNINNLEWVTYKENTAHAWENGVMENLRLSVKKIDKRGEKNPNSKLTRNQMLEIREKYIPYKHSSVQLSLEYGVAHSTILRAIKRIEAQKL